MKKIVITYTAFNKIFVAEYEYNATIGEVHEQLNEICNTYHINNIEIKI